MHRVNSALLWIGLQLIFVYRLISSSFHFLSRMFGLPCQCRFPVSCSEFAENEFKNSKSFIKATQRVILRLLSCSPVSNFVTKGI